jgi:hypothetical protein
MAHDVAGGVAVRALPAAALQQPAPPGPRALVDRAVAQGAARAPTNANSQGRRARRSVRCQEATSAARDGWK